MVVGNAIDGNGVSGWAIWPESNKDHTALFELADEVGDGQGSRLTVRLRQHWPKPGYILGRFRLSITDDATTLQATRTRLDLKDGEIADLNVALGKAHAQQGHTNEAVASFTEATYLTADRAGKARIIAEAAPLAGVLEILAERAAGDTRFQAELARHFAEHGDARQADAALSKARMAFEESLAREPENSAVATDLGDVLLLNTSAWTVLKPTEMKSEGGATLARVLRMVQSWPPVNTQTGTTTPSRLLSDPRKSGPSLWTSCHTRVSAAMWDAEKSVTPSSRNWESLAWTIRAVARLLH